MLNTVNSAIIKIVLYEGKHMAKKKSKRRAAVICAAFVVIIAMLVSPFFTFLRSLAVMGVYSHMHEEKGLAKEEGIELNIPGGLSSPQSDWYPMVMTFVADKSYETFISEPGARLNVLYNFPAFDYSKGCSRLYDMSSPFYSSFYGAYVLRDSSNQEMAKGRPNIDRLAQIAYFDYYHLVVGDFGLTEEQELFDFEITGMEQDVTYCGYDGWVKISADMKMNGSAHNRRENVRSYLQYGAPKYSGIDKEFEAVEMSSLIYGRYFPKWDVSIYFYVIGSSAEFCNNCDADILSKSSLNEK